MNILCLNERTDYISKGLLAVMEQMGDKVTIFPLSRVPWNHQERALKELLRKSDFHFVFTPGWSIGVFNVGAFFRALRQTKTYHVYWATEDPIFFEEVSMVFAPESDFIFTTAQEMQARYQSMGIPSDTLMFGANPRFHYPTTPVPKYCHDIILVANNYPWFPAEKGFRNHGIRTILLPLIEKGYDVRVYGTEWTDTTKEIHIPPEYFGGYCPYEETRHAYSSAKIVLGIQSVNTSPTQTSCRTFEIMASGAFYLTVHTPSHENLFKKHEHLVWSQSPEETVELVDHYLRNEEARQKVARAGMAEVLARHTYQHRAIQLKGALKKHLNRKPFYRIMK